MGRLFLWAGEDAVEGVAFSQLCCGRCWRRVMAASCRGGGAVSCSGGGDHIRGVALNVATRKIEAESDIFTVKRPDYSAEEWRLLYLTTGSDYYLNSVRLVGFCGVGGINWACCDAYEGD